MSTDVVQEPEAEARSPLRVEHSPENPVLGVELDLELRRPCFRQVTERLLPTGLGQGIKFPRKGHVHGFVSSAMCVVFRPFPGGQIGRASPFLDGMRAIARIS